MLQLLFYCFIGVISSYHNLVFCTTIPVENSTTSPSILPDNQIISAFQNISDSEEYDNLSESEEYERLVKQE